MDKNKLIEFVKHLQKFGLDDSNILHNADIIADDFIEAQIVVKKLNITPVVECDAEQSLNKSMCPYCKHSNIDEGIGFQRCNNCDHNYWT